MASAWVETRKTSTGAVRYRVRYRLGGAESPLRYAGLFNTKREAKAREAWVLGQLAAMRVPDIDLLADESRAPTLREAAERWLASRIDVAENTKSNHRSAVAAIVPLIGSRRSTRSKRQTSQSSSRASARAAGARPSGRCCWYSG